MISIKVGGACCPWQLYTNKIMAELKVAPADSLESFKAQKRKKKVC